MPYFQNHILRQVRAHHSTQVASTHPKCSGTYPLLSLTAQPKSPPLTLSAISANGMLLILIGLLPGPLGSAWNHWCADPYFLLDGA